MLTEIRARSSGVFAWVIAALIIIPMAFWGVQDYAPTDAAPVIVKVGDQKITQAQFQQQLTRAQEQALQSNPNIANSDVFNTPTYKRQILRNLINRSALIATADEQQYRIGDSDLAEFIKNDERFQENGAFSASLYDEYLSNLPFSKQEFEDNLRAERQVVQVTTGFQESSLVLPNEVRELLQILTERRTFDLITINSNDFIDDISIPAADIQKYYDDNINDYSEPDRMSINYIELDIATIEQDVAVSEEEIRAIYESDIDSFVSQETRAVRHILLSTDGNTNDSEQRAKASDLIAQINAGADFAELAKSHSQDPGSAPNGGSLGDVEIGQMVPEFEEAAFALSAGDISEPVKSQFGYHIIKVDKINASQPQTFADVRFDLEQEERDRKAQEILLDKVEDLRNLTFEYPDSLAEVAKQLDLTIQTSALFARDNGTDIAGNETIRATAFSEQVLTEGLNSEPIELSSNRYVSLRKNQFVATAPKPLANVSSEIENLLRNQRASAAAEQQGQSVLTKANSDWASVVADSTVSINTYTVSIIDQTPQVANDVSAQVSKLQLTDDQATIHSFAGNGGNFHIVRLVEIAAGDLNTVSEQVKDSTRSLLAQRNGESILRSYINDLGDTMSSEIDSSLL